MEPADRKGIGTTKAELESAVKQAGSRETASDVT
jgi:hypothetical protein